MFSERLRTEAAARSKKGRPAHNTTGVASANWIHCDRRASIRWCAPARCAPISSTNTGKVSSAAIQSRRFMSCSSAFSPVASAAFSGSSAMPHLGQLPGPRCRTSGCMGQVYSASGLPGCCAVFGAL